MAVGISAQVVETARLSRFSLDFRRKVGLRRKVPLTGLQFLAFYCGGLPSKYHRHRRTNAVAAAATASTDKLRVKSAFQIEAVCANAAMRGLPCPLQREH